MDLLLNFLSNNNLDMPIALVVTSLLGLFLRVSLTFCNQSWASTYHHTMTYMLLPVITFVVTRVISGNIFDIIVDIRTNSATFKEWACIRLTKKNRKHAI